MGTNYYAETAACPSACEHCDRAESLHVCKSLTMFRGYVRPYGDSPLPRLGEIRSWAEWRTALRSGQVTRIVDEYGRGHEIETFIADVEGTDPAARQRQYDWMQTHRPDAIRAGHDWLDPDGFSFHDGPFS